MSPDTEDPEAVGTAGEKAAQNEEKEGVVGGIERASTRTWAEEIQYDPVRLFNKVSIEYNVTKCNLCKVKHKTMLASGISQGSGVGWPGVLCRGHHMAYSLASDGK